MIVVLIGVGGAAGAVLRWAVSTLNRAWPAGTLVANVLGSATLGVLVGVTEDPALIALLGVGVLGGLTTFSTVAVEGATLPPRRAAAYIAASLVVGTAAAAAGLGIGHAL